MSFGLQLPGSGSFQQPQTNIFGATPSSYGVAQPALSLPSNGFASSSNIKPATVPASAIDPTLQSTSGALVKEGSSNPADSAGRIITAVNGLVPTLQSVAFYYAL